MFNLARRKGVAKEDPQAWSALEHKVQFENKMATGILFRVQLAYNLKSLGIAVEPKDQYFQIDGITDEIREHFSQRSVQMQKALEAQSLDPALQDPIAKSLAALDTRSAKREPAYNELMEHFTDRAKEVSLKVTQSPEGLWSINQYEVSLDSEQKNRQVVSGAKVGTSTKLESEGNFYIDHKQLVSELLEHSSVLTRQEALKAICTKAMGVWSATQCLEELERFLASPILVALGSTATLTPVFTSKEHLALESDISRLVSDGVQSRVHRVSEEHVKKEFEKLQMELSKRIRQKVDLKEQMQAALHVCSNTGTHAFVEGWAGTGKTTMLKALRSVYEKNGFTLIGTSLSAAAAQNLQQETGIKSGTIASLLLSLDGGTLKISPKSIVVLDEAAMVGSAQFAALQKAVSAAGAKLVCVGDAKQLQPIEAGGIFKTLCETYGSAQITKIQRQRTDFDPLLDHLEERFKKNKAHVSSEHCTAIYALRSLPESERLSALETLCKKDAYIDKVVKRWRTRYDHQWLRKVVQDFATGNAKDALKVLDENGCIHLTSDALSAAKELMQKWSQSSVALEQKTIIAATKNEVTLLNDLARAYLMSDANGAGTKLDPNKQVKVHVSVDDITHQERSVCVGERMVFLKNDKSLQVANGQTATVVGIRVSGTGSPILFLRMDAQLDEKGNKRIVKVDLQDYNHMDYAYCLTNHKSQGRTYEQAFVLVNPMLADRQWSYVACSRSRHQTSLFVPAGSLVPFIQQSSTQSVQEVKGHQEDEAPQKVHTKADLLDALAKRMSISHAKGTSLDYAPIASDISQKVQSTPSALETIKALALKVRTVGEHLILKPTGLSSAQAAMHKEVNGLQNSTISKDLVHEKEYSP